VRRRREPSPRVLEAETEVRVRFQEVDLLGVVWHGHYLTYFEDARIAWGERYGLTYQGIRDAGYAAPIVRSEVEHFLPARYGDVLRLRARLHEDPGARLRFTYVALDAEGREVAAGGTTQAFTDFSGNLVLTQPPFYEEFLARWRSEFRQA